MRGFRFAGSTTMICRIWRGWTTPAKAGAYEAIVRGQVIPGIEAMGVPGFRHIDLMRRDLGEEVEFVTAMWFDDLGAIKAFVGDDYTVSHVPAAARAVLKRFDAHAAHYEVLDRRTQPAP
jgi:hypothetical protein